MSMEKSNAKKHPLDETCLEHQQDFPLVVPCLNSIESATEGKEFDIRKAIKKKGADNFQCTGHANAEDRKLFASRSVSPQQPNQLCREEAAAVTTRPGAVAVPGVAASNSATDEEATVVIGGEDNSTVPHQMAEGTPVLEAKAHLVDEAADRERLHQEIISDAPRASIVEVEVPTTTDISTKMGAKLRQEKCRFQILLIGAVVLVLGGVGLVLGLVLSQTASTATVLSTDTPTASPTATPDLALDWDQVGQDILGLGEEDRFGQSIALSSDGRRVAIGAPYHGSCGGSCGSGLVRVYERAENNKWKLIGDIAGTPENEDGRAGWSVSLSGDGNTVATGAYAHLKNGVLGVGQVRVLEYDLDSSSWRPLGNDMTGQRSQENFGTSVTLSEDGRAVAICSGGNSQIGATAIYEYRSGNWAQLGGEIVGKTGRGHASLSANGRIVAVGRYVYAGVGDAESVYATVYHFDGGSWSPIGEWLALEDASDKDSFGNDPFRVTLSKDGSTVGVGAHRLGSGRVRIYRYSEGNSTWFQLGKDINGNMTGDYAGWSLALSEDGSSVAIGAPSNGNNAGQVRVFQHDGFSWVPVGDGVDGDFAGDDGGSGGDRLGYSVSLSANARVLAAGAIFNSLNGRRSGYAKVFELASM